MKKFLVLLVCYSICWAIQSHIYTWVSLSILVRDEHSSEDKDVCEAVRMRGAWGPRTICKPEGGQTQAKWGPNGGPDVRQTSARLTSLTYINMATDRQQVCKQLRTLQFNNSESYLIAACSWICLGSALQSSYGPAISLPLPCNGHAMGLPVIMLVH